MNADWIQGGLRIRRAILQGCVAGMLALALGSARPAQAQAQTQAQPQPQPQTQTSAPPPSDAQTTAPWTTPQGDAEAVGDSDRAAMAAESSPAARQAAAWKLLTDAMSDAKHPQTRIQALAALGLLRSSRSEKMIADAMADPDVDVRTAAVLAAELTRDRNFTTGIRNLLDDREPEVAFTAATSLWKMGDRSGEDILMSVMNGERSAGPTIMRGTEHKISRDLHDPAMLARLGARQGAAMILGPFGFGIAAYEYVRQTGGDLARVSAIEQLSQERTQPIHRELLAALADKDPTVRAAAAKALADYHDAATSAAVYALLVDPRQPVRLTAAAAYLRTDGVPGPAAANPGAESHPRRRRK